MSTAREPTLRQPGDGRTVGVVGDVYRFLATAEETDGKYALFKALAPPAAARRLIDTAGRKRPFSFSRENSLSTSTENASWPARARSSTRRSAVCIISGMNCESRQDC